MCASAPGHPRPVSVLVSSPSGGLQILAVPQSGPVAGNFRGGRPDQPSSQDRGQRLSAAALFSSDDSEVT